MKEKIKLKTTKDITQDELESFFREQEIGEPFIA